jgi:RimJ/RimL family protein N-acetyltransferase
MDIRAPDEEEVDPLVLSEGTGPLLRPLEPDDRDDLAALFGRLSPQSRFTRFFSAKPALSADELTHLTGIDHLHHEAIAAVDTADGSLVGVARYVVDPDRPAVADVAVEVADDLQRLGIGSLITSRLADRACTNNVALLTATTLRENPAARALLKGLGFRPVASGGREIQVAARPGNPVSAPARRILRWDWWMTLNSQG